MNFRFIISFFIISIILIQPVVSWEDIFEVAGPGIAPPEFPIDEVEENVSGVFVILIDAENGNELKDIHVRFELENRDTKERINTIRYLLTGNTVLNIPNGRWSMVLKADDLSTEGKDYYTTLSFTYQNYSQMSKVNAYMQPVGSVRGEVIDDEGKLVVDAKVKFECSAEYGELTTTKTDTFGSFKGEWLPPSKCKISALSDDRVGSVELNIETGSLKDVSINLEKTVAPPFTGHKASDNTTYIVIAIVVLALALYVFSRRRKVTYELEDIDGPINPSDAMLLIMETLTEEQNRIIEELLKAGGRLSQADIGYKTGIPKASVSRYIYRLESKKIVETTKIGRMKDVRISKWFLSQ